MYRSGIPTDTICSFKPMHEQHASFSSRGEKIMKSNLFLFARLAIVIMIAGGIIVFLTTSVKNNGITTETVVETQMTDVQATKEELKEGFFAEDGYVRQYEDGDVFWEWQIEDLSEDAKIIVMNSSMQYICVQEGHKVWLINGRDNAQLIAENGEAFSYPFFEGDADGYIEVEDGVLYFQRLYPFDKEGRTDQDELVDGVEEIIGHRGFVRDGKYWLLGGDALDWEVADAPVFELGDNPIIRRDLERLRDNDITIGDFNKKYAIDP